MRQPWASAITLGLKQYETRSRPTKVRGRIAIHAARAVPLRRGSSRRVASDVTVIHFWHDGLWIETGAGLQREMRGLPLGAVVATAELVDCIPTDGADIGDLERALGDWTPGRWAWRLDDVAALIEPVGAKGKQGWWDWDEPEVTSVTNVGERLVDPPSPLTGRIERRSVAGATQIPSADARVPLARPTYSVDPDAADPADGAS